MAALLRPTRCSLLHLPPAVRVDTYRLSINRSFSASAARSVDTNLDQVVTAIPTALIDSIHALGLPWYAALPATAFMVRGFFVYYWETKPQRRTQQIRTNLAPLAAARAVLEPKIDMSRYKGLSNGPVKNALYNFFKWRQSEKLLSQESKNFGAPPWTLGGPLNFLILIMFSEAVRQKCSSQRGILSALLSPFEWLANKLSPGTFTQHAAPAAQMVPLSSLSAEELHRKANEHVKELTESGQVPVNADGVPILDHEAFMASLQASIQPSTPAPAPNAWFDPSLTTEGLSWCPDLTAADSTGILPLTLTLSIAATAILRPRFPPRKKASASPHSITPVLPEGVDPSSPEGRVLMTPVKVPTAKTGPFAGFNNGQRLRLIFAAFMGFAVTNMPAAILLYWVPSVFIGWLQGRWLDWKMPIRQPILACKRRLRYRLRKEWSD